jgi:hypothetical protein
MIKECMCNIVNQMDPALGEMIANSELEGHPGWLHARPSLPSFFEAIKAPLAGMGMGMGMGVSDHFVVRQKTAPTITKGGQTSFQKLGGYPA